MIEFTQFVAAMKRHFANITANTTTLFEVEINKDVLWNLYLDSFPAGTNGIYRTRRAFDCGECRHFIKTMGNVVVIKDNQIVTIWGFETGDPDYQAVADAMNAYILSRPVADVFITKEKKIGVARSYDLSDTGPTTWDHFCLELPPDSRSNKSGPLMKSDESIKAIFRSTRDVFKRSLEEITEDSLLTVLELMAQKSLYKGEEWVHVIKDFLKLKKEYVNLASNAERDNYTWSKSVETNAVVARLRNHSMGTLLVNISEGMPLDRAVQRYEAIVAPSNYKRPKAIYTQQMLDKAREAVEAMGYGPSLERRYAVLEDITVNNVLFSNRDAARRMSGIASIFDTMRSGTVIDPKRFSRVEEIPAERFFNEVIRGVTKMEVYLENRHAPNLVSLIAPQNRAAKSMFKWKNGFSWAYSGNMTDSDIKSQVKAAGGAVDGVLRFSLEWNDRDEHDKNDLDAHCIEPNRCEIYYAHRYDHATGGNLDIDIVMPKEGVPAVENITWPIKKNMPIGGYRFFVRNFSNRGGRGGFRAEIEFEGQIYQFEYHKELRNKEDVDVAVVTLDRNGNFSIEERLPAHCSSKDIWGLKTNLFVPVTVVTYSPNYWDETVGHKHYFFMLTGCQNTENPNGFYNEFLKEELLEYKHVFEALGSRMHVNESVDQLSGLGFSSTKRADVVVKITGSTERVVKIIF